MSNCKNCGQPLTKGNIKVVRKPGKRTVRVCRRCRCPAKVDPKLTAISLSYGERTSNDTGTVVQRPQGTTGGPFTAEVVYLDSSPMRYRFFMTQDQAEKVKERMAKPLVPGFGIGLEMIPVPDYQVDQEPDAYAGLVEVVISGYNGDNE